MANKIQVTYRCDKENGLGTSLLPPNGGKTVKCELCGLKMHVDPVALEIGAHGKTAATLAHTLLQVKEIGVEE